MSTHTPTPWMVDNFYIAAVGVEAPLASMLGDFEVARANAAHIVKCVNAHDDLVAERDCYLVALNAIIAASPPQQPSIDSLYSAGKYDQAQIAIKAIDAMLAAAEA